MRERARDGERNDAEERRDEADALLGVAEDRGARTDDRRDRGRVVEEAPGQVPRPHPVVGLVLCELEAARQGEVPRDQQTDEVPRLEPELRHRGSPGSQRPPALRRHCRPTP